MQKYKTISHSTTLSQNKIAPTYRGYLLHLWCINQKCKEMKDLNHPARNADIKDNFKKDTGLDWDKNINEYLSYVNIYVFRENIAVLKQDIRDVADGISTLNLLLTKK